MAVAVHITVALRLVDMPRRTLLSRTTLGTFTEKERVEGFHGSGARLLGLRWQT